MISESADNLRRIERILASIDVPQGNDPQVVTLRHVSALEAARSLQTLFPAGSANGGGNWSVGTDLRGNRLFLRSDNPALQVRAARMAAEMDRPEAGVGNIRVVPLKQRRRGATGANPARHPRQRRRHDAKCRQPAVASLGVGQNTLAGSAQSNALAPAGNAASATGGSQHNSGGLQPGSMIQADPASNSLIVTAPDSPVRQPAERHRAARPAPGAGAHRGADRRTVGRAGRRIRHPVADPSGLSGNGTRAVGGTNFGNSSQNIVSAATSMANLAAA